MKPAGCFFDLLLILSLTVWIIGAVMVGRISGEHAALALLGLVALIAVSRGLGSSLIRLTFRIAVPVASVAALVLWSGSGDPRSTTAILGTLGALVLVLFGLYVMVRGLFSRR